MSDISWIVYRTCPFVVYKAREIPRQIEKAREPREPKSTYDPVGNVLQVSNFESRVRFSRVESPQEKQVLSYPPNVVLVLSSKRWYKRGWEM